MFSYGKIHVSQMSTVLAVMFFFLDTISICTGEEMGPDQIICTLCDVFEQFQAELKVVSSGRT